MKLANLLRGSSDAPTLRERAEAVRAGLSPRNPSAGRRAVAVEPQPFEPAAVEPDPALAVAADHLAAWNAAEAVALATGDVPDEESDALGKAYGRLRAVRPTTAAGFRALAEAWALELKGERGDEPSLMLADHAADSLIAGAGVCVPIAAEPALAGTLASMQDPAFAAIEAHRAAYAEWDRLASVWNGIASHEPGYAEAQAAAALLGRREVETYEALFTTRPTTLQGAVALTAYFVTAVRTASIDAEPSDGERALRVVSDALARLTGNTPQAGLPNFDANALIVAIEAEWAVWAAFDGADPGDGDPAFEACLARRQALLSAADALSADSTAARHAKALALAWLEYTDIWERGRRYEDYGTDGRLALAIHAALAGSPVQTGAKLKPPSLVGMVDFASASMDELRALHDTANEVGSFAYALTWSGRCRDRALPSHGMPGDGYNVVGSLMIWLGDALASVETAALEEAKRRAPDDTVDRSTRLELMARSILENDDPDQIEAFGRELLTHAAAERARS